MFTRAYLLLSPVAVVAIWMGWTGALESRAKVVYSGALLAGVAPMLWVDTVIVCGLRSLRTVPMMARIFLRTKRGVTLTSTLACVFAFWLSPLGASSPYRFGMSGLTAAVIVLLWLQPPFALVLGASTPQTVQTIRQVASAAFPLRVVALIDHERAGVIMRAFSSMTDDLRTRSNDDWRAIVDGLAASVFLIVLDTRLSTPIVESEIELVVADEQRHPRTIFIADENDESRAPQVQRISKDEIETCIARRVLRIR